MTGSFELASLGALPLHYLTSLSIKQWLLLGVTIIVARTIAMYIYNAFFHPLAKYPGPRLASVSNMWTAWNNSRGRWPFVVEDAMKKYGDVVRIGPDSLVFLDPQAVLDIHGPKRDLKQTFIKTPTVEGLGDEDDGLLWERDPEKHRRVSKMMSPAFSGNSLRAKIPTANKYIDDMMSKIKEGGASEQGADLSTWLQWLCMDVAADLAYSWEMGNLKEMKDHPFLTSMEATNFLIVMLANLKTYPLLTPLAILVMPWSVIRAAPRLISELRVRVVERIDKRFNLDHSDYFEQLLPPEKDPKERKSNHMLTVAGQLIIGGYDPTSAAIFFFFYFVLREENTAVFEELKKEIREGFERYEDIDADVLRTLPWLNACLSETLRMSASATHHSLPRISPGGLVNGEFIPEGTIVRASLFTYSRSPRFWHQPERFLPQRWLSDTQDPRYDAVFASDDRRAHLPFITGPRQCPGREIARIMFRLVVAKMVWLYDVEQVSRPLDFDRDFRVWGMWQKPELRVKLTPVER